MPIVHVDHIDHVQQVDDQGCGPACCSMVLSSLVRPNQSYPGEPDLANIVGRYTTPLAYGNPIGLAMALEAYASRNFDARGLDSPCDASATVAAALATYGVAVPVMVYGCCHWVAVSGVETDNQIGGKKDYAIQAISFFNPADTSCPNHKGPENHATYREWVDTYLLGCSTFRNMFNVVVDSRLPAQSCPRSLRASLRASSRRLIDAGNAYEAACRGLSQYGIVHRDGHEPRALLVQRIDRQDEYYYLVPLSAPDESTIIVRVDALDGAYLGALLRCDGFDYVSPREFFEQLVMEERLIEFLDLPTNLRAETFTVHPCLVWKPCVQSRSPYQPLYQLNRGGTLNYFDGSRTFYSEIKDLKCVLRP